MTTLTYTRQTLDFVRLDASDQLRRSRDFLALMRRRPSERRFSSEPVDIELIENALKTGAQLLRQWAVLDSNQRPWD